MPFNAPFQVWNTSALATCKERSRFDYINPCSNRANYAANFTIGTQDYSLTPDGSPLDGRWKRCTGAHARGHSMCRYCIAATEDQPWFKKAYNYIVANNPAPTQHAESNRSSHYLTRMCRLCEYREEVLLAQLGGNAPGAPFVPPPPGLVPPQNHPTQDELDWVSDWPTNRCTCEKKGLYNGILCLPHRKQQWMDFKKENDVKRRHNRKYLMNTEADQQGDRVDSTQATKNHRRAAKLHRACRCGSDPVATIAEATVMQCMACEGIVHLLYTPGGHQPAPLTLPNPPPSAFQLLRNSLATPDEFTITGKWGNERRADD